MPNSCGRLSTALASLSNANMFVLPLTGIPFYEWKGRRRLEQQSLSTLAQRAFGPAIQIDGARPTQSR
jgi:hypothetical protein